MTADHTRPTNTTRDSEVRAAHAEHAPGRDPTPDEERAAEKHKASPDVAEHYQEMTERGANQKGEGRPG
ncbi:MAG TPA: hypothetical protein VFH50_02415 [Acidimicrobiales bacterium]|nr:hypothetical protein [Acidimicrobiales bacterium]